MERHTLDGARVWLAAGLLPMGTPRGGLAGQNARFLVDLVPWLAGVPEGAP